MADGKKRNVLIVEDHPKLSNHLRSCIEQLGMSADEARNGRAALDRLAAGRPDLICLDLMLPESSGYEVCEFIRNQPQFKGVPVLVMGESSLPADRATAAEAGADAFLPKPFTDEQFTRRVTDLLARRKAGDE